MTRHWTLSLALSAALGLIPAGAGAAELCVPEGFAALYNGKDLTNWQGLVELPQRMKLAADPGKLAATQKAANERILPHWTAAADGVLHYDGKANSLQTAKDYRDFELRLEYKIGPHGDSGIYLRGCPQVQIWDPADHPEGSGGLYNNQKNPNKPLKCADRPVNEWNRLQIIMRGPRVTVWLNNELVTDHVVMENYWNRKEPIPESGPIELQHHSHPLEFRNIFIKEL